MAVARTPNPYRPGFNQEPLALAGRDHVMDAIEEALAVAALDHRTPRPLILTGSRGVGKTVVLSAAASHAAETYGWLTVRIEIRAGLSFRDQMISELLAARDLYRQAPPGKRFAVTSATLKATVGVMSGEVGVTRAAPETPEPAPTFDLALTAACEAAIERGAGLVITIDEIQLANRTELGDFAATLQQHTPDGWPLVVICAGLPSIRSTHRSVTYLERAEWHVLDLLDTAAAEYALQEPAREAGRPMSTEAAELLAEASSGYPFGIQLMGHHAWRASAGSSTIEASHTTEAIAEANRELEGLYEGRWDDASDLEQEYLAVLAELSQQHPQEPVTGSMVAAQLGRTPKSLSSTRDKLIQKGLIFAQRETLRFAIPDMADWVHTHHRAETS